jgi:hypothetical protein
MKNLNPPKIAALLTRIPGATLSNNEKHFPLVWRKARFEHDAIA